LLRSPNEIGGVGMYPQSGTGGMGDGIPHH